MKYLVDVEAVVRIKNIEIEVDEFDQKAMAIKAVEKWLRSVRYDSLKGCASGVDVEDEYLTTWDLRD